ncbi:sensor histidine kinase [Oligella sp. MSHR50489EDL]|uniref:sensor histidine kinase n=1 Tax=Oligella sp. MSHR50489EDL TaxID=3139409 RepID=UPI003D818081
MTCFFTPIYAKTWLVGIQAPNGASSTQQEWQPWIDWLSSLFADDDFSLVALNTNDFEQSLQSNRLDFVIAQPMQLLLLPEPIAFQRLASLENHPTMKSFNDYQIGSAIWVNKESTINELKELEHKKIAAVSPLAFGGFLAGLAALQYQGVSENNLTVSFTEYPVSKGLSLLAKHEVDATIMPFCLMEELEEKVREGISQDFKLLQPSVPNAKCKGNIVFRANWLLVAMPQTPSSLNKKIIRALLSDEVPDDLPHWQVPQATEEAEKVLFELGHHPYQQNMWDSLKILVGKYWLWFMLLGLISALMVVNHIVAIYLARRRLYDYQKANHALLKTEQMMYKADRLYTLGEMTSGIAHELNQPLASIAYYVNGLKLQLKAQKLTEAKLESALDNIAKEIETSKQIIFNIRRWSKLKSSDGMKKLHIIKIFKEVNFFIQQHNHHLSITIECSPKDYVMAEEVKLKQILVNCVLNSVQANAQTIILRANTSSIEIIDDGTGFTAEQLNFPFIPFRTSKPDGLGIGLVVCERMAKSMDMNMKLENLPNHHGAKITLNWATIE